MSHRKSVSILSTLALAALLALPQSAAACAACFGKSDDKLAQGMNMGIFCLLGVVVFVLGAFAAFFILLLPAFLGVVSVFPITRQQLGLGEFAFFEDGVEVEFFGLFAKSGEVPGQVSVFGGENRFTGFDIREH